MEFDKNIAVQWIDGISVALPSLRDILKLTTSEILIIGAGVFDIYYEQGWIPAFKRKTGDLDVSIGLVSGADDYLVIKNALLRHGYLASDVRCPYRLFSPRKMPGAITYVDLLAHPAEAQISAELTKQIMGAGPEFSFSGISFARKAAYTVEGGILCPNPIAMVALKRSAYLDNPMGRIKDLADIAELAWGIVEKGLHFEMGPLWQKLRPIEEALQVRQTLAELGTGASPVWDLDNARQELLKRNFSSSEIDDLIPARLVEWYQFLPL